MIARPLAVSSLLLLAPSLAWAAPPSTSDRPPVQRPSSIPSETPSDAPTAAPESAPPETASPSDPGPSDVPPTEPASAPASAATDVGADSPSEPAGAAAPTPASAAGPEAGPEAGPAGQEDLSNLLVSDEPEATSARIRVAPDERGRVDRSERLRNYYARTYRPVENPSRIHFAARGAFALAGTGGDTAGGGRLGFANLELGQTWNHVSYGVGAALFAGSMTFGEIGVEKYAPILVGGGPSIGLGRLGLLGRGYLDLSAGYNFFYAPVSSTRAELRDPPNAAPHGPKVQIDVGLLLHDSESRRFRHGIGATIGWQMLVHSLAGDYPLVNSFMVGLGYFFG